MQIATCSSINNDEQIVLAQKDATKVIERYQDLRAMGRADATYLSVSLYDTPGHELGARTGARRSARAGTTACNWLLF